MRRAEAGWLLAVLLALLPAAASAQQDDLDALGLGPGAEGPSAVSVAGDDLGMSTGAAALPDMGIDFDFGIPDAPAWMDPSKAGREEEARRKALLDPLESDFWERLRMDMAALERWRGGLLEALRFTEGRPEVFPIEPIERPQLFDEYQETALRTWARAMDYWMGLETLLQRYRRFPVLSDETKRRAAFLAAYSAHLAQARFAKRWTRMAARDPGLEQLFNRPLKSLGLPAGSYTRLLLRYEDAGALSAPGAAQYRRIGRGRALSKLLGRRKRRVWERRRAEDWRALEFVGKLPPKSKVLFALRDKTFAGTFPVRSAAHPWTEGLAPAADFMEPFLLPPPAWEQVTVSTRVIYAIETVRHWFRMDPSTSTRPAALISSGQVRLVSERIRPGDILLVRRERFLSDIGLPGFWHHAGLYIGTPAERKRMFGSDETDKQLQEIRSEAYRRNYVVRRKGEEPPPGAPKVADTVLEALPGGVGLSSLPHFAAADSLAVLRPRLAPEALARAIVRAFRLLGRPYDHLYDARKDDAVSSAELLYHAFHSGGRGLRIPLRETYGRWCVSSNDLARKYDDEYGTEEQELDRVFFLDGVEKEREARFSDLAEFRRSSRRPKWVLIKQEILQ